MFLTSLRLLLALLLFLACAGGAAAQELDNPAFTTKAWTTDDGLPHNTITRAIQDRSGYIWFGTSAGLARFDGREFVTIALSAKSPAATYNIRGLAEEPSGALVVLASSGEVFRITGSTSSVHPCSAFVSQLPDEPRDLYVEPSGAIWLSTRLGALLRWAENEKPALISIKGGTDRRTRRVSFSTEADGVTWIATDGILAAFRNGELEYREDSPTGPLLITSSRDGATWLCTEDRLLKMREGKISAVMEKVFWAGNLDSVRQVVETRHGDLFFAGTRKLMRYRQNEFEQVASVQTGANHLLEDSDGKIWVGTAGTGVIYLRERRHRLYNQESGLSGDRVSALAEDKAGGLWIANRTGGLYYLEQGRSQATRVTDPSLISIDTVAADVSGAVWFSSARSGLWKIASRGAVPEQMYPTPSDDVNAVLATRAGDLWFATMGGTLGRFHDGKIALFDGGQGYPRFHVFAMAERASGEIWIGGRNGMLFRWTGERFERIESPAHQASIHDLRVDESGRMWAATAGGLLVEDDGQLRLLSGRQGLPDTILYNIVDDTKGRLWLGTRRGLFHLPIAELLDAARQKGRRVAAHRFGPDQGLRSFTSTPNFTPGALRSSTGIVWLASAQGALAIEAGWLTERPALRPLQVDAVKFDGKVQKKIFGGPALRFPSGAHRIELKLVLPVFADPANIKIEHRLAGFDPTWVNTPGDRVATYTRLAPGAYTLYGKAGYDSSAEPETKLLEFTVVAAWYELTSVRIALVLAIIVAAAGAARAVVQRRLRWRLALLEQQNALSKERSRIARDLHDELGAALTAVGLHADRLVEAAPRDLAEQLSGLAWRTRRLATDLSGIVWAMSADHTTLRDLAVFMRSYAERLFRATAVACATNGVEALPRLPLAPGTQHHLLAATKEALNNVLKHAHATSVIINLRYVDSVVEVEITDNGLGVNTDSLDIAEGNGIKNMRTRMEEMGGELKFASRQPGGTIVTLRVTVTSTQTADV